MRHDVEVIAGALDQERMVVVRYRTCELIIYFYYDMNAADGVSVVQVPALGVNAKMRNEEAPDQAKVAHSFYAQDWVHLADQLEGLGFPGIFLDFLRQAAGEEGYEKLYFRKGTSPLGFH